MTARDIRRAAEIVAELAVLVSVLVAIVAALSLADVR